jgi:hypothetical protein
MGDVIQYRLYCETEATNKEWLLDETAAAPTTCPTDTAHTITSESVTVIGNITSTPKKRDDDVMYAVPKAASFGLEMCDRDFKLCLSKMDEKALHSVVGADPTNGTVTYISARAGAHGNDHSITVETGDTGAGHESRALAVSRTGEDITVTFGTDGSGNSLTPTANDVAALVNADYDIALHHLNAVPGGDGTGAVNAVAQTSLAGGTTVSCEDLYVDVDNLKEVSWGELTQIGCYKKSGNDYVACDDDADAVLNAELSVWEYTAINPATHDLLKYEIRDGYLVVDSSIDAVNEKWDHRAYAVGAVLIPAAQGGRIRMFDGYLGPAPNGLIDAKSQQTSVMDPDLGPGASSLRLYVYYKKASTLCHVLRLVTYRAPGTYPG